MGLVSCLSLVPVQNMAREFSYHKQNKIVVLIPPSKDDIFMSFYPLNPYDYDLSDSVYNMEESRFLKYFGDSLVIDLFMRGLKESLDYYNIRLLIPDSKDLILQHNEKAYFYSVAQMEILEYIDTVEIKSDSVYIKIPGEKYAYVYTTSELANMKFSDTVEKIDELDTLPNVREFSRRNVVANTWLEYTELENPERPTQVLFSMQYTSDLFDGYFMIEYPRIEVKFVSQEYMIYINDVIELIYYLGYKNGEYIADYIFNLYLEERLGEENLKYYYRYDPDISRARRVDDDRFIIIDP